MTRHYVTPDADGTPVLWGELGGPDPQMVACRDGDRIHVAETQADRIWALLTAVLAPDEATVERLGRTVAEYDGHNWDTAHPDEQDAYVEHVNVTLAALAGTRDTDTEAVGGQ